MLLKPRKNLVTVLDVGSFKIAAVVARIYDGEISVIGCVQKVSSGIRNGSIVDVKKAIASIASVIEELESVCDENIDSTYITFSGCSVQSDYVDMEVLTSANEINENDIRTVISKGYDNFKDNDSEEVIHCVPIEYLLDGAESVDNPVGMYSSSLSVKLHVVTVSKTSLFNILNCLKRCHLNSMGSIVSSLANFYSCVNTSDSNLGVTVLDIGGGGVSIGVYKNGHMIYNSSVAIGGINITKDIACAFSISVELAEKIKILFGTLGYIDEEYDEIIDYTNLLEKSDMGSRDMRTISRFRLSEVIRARVEEMLEMIREKMVMLGISSNSFFSKVIITGGTSKLDGLKEFISEFLGVSVVAGKQCGLYYSDVDISDPVFSAITGSLLFINESNKSNNMSDAMPNKGKVIRWLQKHF